MMKIPRVYVDSSIILGCCDLYHNAWSRGLMEDFKSGLYKPVISELVEAEMMDVPDEGLEAYANFLKTDPQIIPFTEKADTLAEIYLDRKVVSEGFYHDALHVAMATLEEVDIFVTWDHPNILHFSKVRGFVQVNIELGLKPIQIRCARLVASNEYKRN